MKSIELCKQFETDLKEIESVYTRIISKIDDVEDDSKVSLTTRFMFNCLEKIFRQNRMDIQTILKELSSYIDKIEESIKC